MTEYEAGRRDERRRIEAELDNLVQFAEEKLSPIPQYSLSKAWLQLARALKVVMNQNGQEDKL